jgi:hypothetical protein
VQAEIAPPKVKVQKLKSKRPERCYPARAAVPYYRTLTHTWQALRGSERLAGPGPRVRGRSCGFARYAASEWQGRARAAKDTYYRWKEERTLKEQATWIRAIREAQRAYPGTEGWLRSCSATEGAGRSLSINYFQMNHQGSGAGGWLQFMHSTFVRMFSAAHADVTARGFLVPPSAHSWSSRLGQALAGGWAARNGGTGEWSGSGC